MTDEPPQAIDVAKLRVVLDHILNGIESEQGSLIPIDRDHYWLIELDSTFSDDLHQPGTQEGDFGVGQVSDDIDSLATMYEEIDAGDFGATPWHDLEHAVGLLRALAWLDEPREA